jgi:phage-related protein
LWADDEVVDSRAGTRSGKIKAENFTIRPSCLSVFPYNREMSTGPESKDLVFIEREIKTPPMSTEARREAGALLRLVQDGELLGMPRSRPMPSIGPGCHEIRVRDEDANWRIFYRIESDIVLVILIHKKTTQKTPKRVIDLCKKRLKDHDSR